MNRQNSDRTLYMVFNNSFVEKMLKKQITIQPQEYKYYSSNCRWRIPPIFSGYMQYNWTLPISPLRTWCSRKLSPFSVLSPRKNTYKCYHQTTTALRLNICIQYYLLTQRNYVSSTHIPELHARKIILKDASSKNQ